MYSELRLKQYLKSHYLSFYVSSCVTNSDTHWCLQCVHACVYLVGDAGNLPHWLRHICWNWNDLPWSRDGSIFLSLSPLRVPTSQQWRLSRRRRRLLVWYSIARQQWKAAMTFVVNTNMQIIYFAQLRSKGPRCEPHSSSFITWCCAILSPSPPAGMSSRCYHRPLRRQ